MVPRASSRPSKAKCLPVTGWDNQARRTLPCRVWAVSSLGGGDFLVQHHGRGPRVGQVRDGGEAGMQQQIGNLRFQSVVGVKVQSDFVALILVFVG